MGQKNRRFDFIPQLTWGVGGWGGFPLSTSGKWKGGDIRISAINLSFLFNNSGENSGRLKAAVCHLTVQNYPVGTVP